MRIRILSALIRAYCAWCLVVMEEVSGRRRLLVLYGSQSGTAEDLAQRVGREARRRYFEAAVTAMDKYDKVSLL